MGRTESRATPRPCRAEAREVLPGPARSAGEDRSSALAPTATDPEQEAMTRESLVEPQRTLLQRREGHVPGGEADPGADRGDVVEVVVEALQLEQQGAGAAQLPRGHKSEGDSQACA